MSTAVAPIASTQRITRNWKHGKRHSPEYVVWRNMNSRCHNPNHKSFADYGGRGITVCPEWRGSFIAFYSEMGDRPGIGYQIDRIDNNRGYFPGNCKWSSVSDQARNRRSSVFLTIGSITKTLSEWSMERGIKQGTIAMRLKAGWSVERALTLPARLKRAAQRKTNA